MALKHIKEIVEDKSKNSNYFLLERVRNRWVDIVGLQLASKSYPVFIKDKKLKIAAENSAWITQLNFLKEKIKENINLRFNDFIVDKIDFVVEMGRKSLELKEEDKEETLFSIADVTLSKEDILTIKSVVREIEDLEIKESMYKMLSNNFKRIKKLKEQGLIKCMLCGSYTFEKDRVCDTCKANQERDRVSKIIKLFYKKPSIAYLEAKQEIGSLTHFEFTKVKMHLLERWRTFLERTYDSQDESYYRLLIKYYRVMFETEDDKFIVEKIKYFKLEQEEKRKKKDGGKERGRIFSKRY